MKLKGRIPRHVCIILICQPLLFSELEEQSFDLGSEFVDMLKIFETLSAFNPKCSNINGKIFILVDVLMPVSPFTNRKSKFLRFSSRKSIAYVSNSAESVRLNFERLYFKRNTLD